MEGNVGRVLCSHRMSLCSRLHSKSNRQSDALFRGGSRQKELARKKKTPHRRLFKIAIKSPRISQVLNCTKNFLRQNCPKFRIKNCLCKCWKIIKVMILKGGSRTRTLSSADPKDAPHPTGQHIRKPGWLLPTTRKILLEE